MILPVDVGSFQIKFFGEVFDLLKQCLIILVKFQLTDQIIDLAKRPLHGNVLVTFGRAGNIIGDQILLYLTLGVAQKLEIK